MTNSLTWNPEIPYNALPNLPPANDIETKAILKQCITARAALAELKKAAELIPNQTMLINTIPYLEAQGSSEIENIVTTTDKLFRFAGDISQETDPATKEALRYRAALSCGCREIAARPLSPATAITVCGKLKGVEMNLRHSPGTALANDSSGRVVYTPPEGAPALEKLLNNWAHFLHERDDIDPLIRMAVGHYQFEAIHPFTDGNGRTGRVLNILFLIQNDLLNLPVLYLSRYLIAHKSDYYRLLLNVTQTGEWESWIIYMLKAVEETSRWTTEKIAAIRALHEKTKDFVRTKKPKIYSHELVEALFEQPYCRINTLIEKGVGKRDSASHYLGELAALGVLSEIKIGREKLFINEKLMQLLRQDGNEIADF